MKIKWMRPSALALGALLALGVGVALAQGPVPTGPDQPAVSPAFTYQGKLVREGTPVTAQCDMTFSLWDAQVGGSQIGSDSVSYDVPVNEGLFTVPVDENEVFGASAFSGRERWLEVEVRCPGDADYVVLSPRQELTATPYAHGLSLPYHGFYSTDQDLFFLHNMEGRALHAMTGLDEAISATSAGPRTIYADNSATDGGCGVSGFASATTGTSYGVFGESASTSGRGVYGLSTALTGTTYGVYGQADSTAYGYGVYGSAPRFGVYGLASATSNSAYGIYGQANSPDGRGVFGLSLAITGTTYGVYGQANSPDGRGVYGRAAASSGTTYGVFGETASSSTLWPGNQAAGVYGLASATSGNAAGVLGRSNSSSGYGGYFVGNVSVQGTLSKGGGSFKIDHPLDPAGKYLYHSFVESPDMMNVYNGNVVLDADGAAWVELPAWFAALNGGEEYRSDFRYQLTCIGGYAPVYVAQEIQDNRFQIAGGTAGLKVSWQVTGIRHDPWAEAHRIPVEQDKPAGEQGTYLYPELYGQPEELGLHYQFPRSGGEPATPEAPPPGTMPE